MRGSSAFNFQPTQVFSGPGKSGERHRCGSRRPRKTRQGEHCDAKKMGVEMHMGEARLRQGAGARRGVGAEGFAAGAGERLEERNGRG